MFESDYDDDDSALVAEKEYRERIQMIEDFKICLRQIRNLRETQDCPECEKC